MTFTTDQWVILMLVFVLGLLIGGFLFSGGGRKWKHRYNGEVDRRRELEKAHSATEKDWREQDKQREALLRDAERNRVVAAPVAAPVAAATPIAAAPLVSPATATDVRDTNRDGVVSANEAAVSPVISDTRDTNRDGVVDADEAVAPRPDGPLLRKKTPRTAGGIMDNILGRDRDRDGDSVPDRDE